MNTAATALLRGDLLTVRPYEKGLEPVSDESRTFVVQVADKAASNTLLASLPLIDRLLSEKVAAVRKRKLAEMVDFMAARMVQPSAAEMQMAQRLAERHARVLNEFGFHTAEELAEINGSAAKNRSALADNWRRRRQIFAVLHPDPAHAGAVFPAFQFRGGKPLKVVQQVLEAFAGRRASWKLALWFTSGNGLLPESARPVDLLASDPEAVLRAAQSDAQGSAA